MNILKYTKYFVGFLFLFSSCNEYIEDKEIYSHFSIKNWTTKGNVTAKLYRYEKGTNFKKIISIDSLFEITYDTKNHYLAVSPEFVNEKPIYDDMVLLINDSIEYKFTDVYFIKDTLKLANPLGFLGRKIIVRYNLKATVNDEKINYLDTIKSVHAPSYISLGNKIK